jgi:hypothetical protein
MEVRGSLPSPRLGHSCVMLNSKVLVVFGGYGGPEGHSKYNEINLLHFDTMMWTQPTIHGPIPPPMYAHRSVAVGGDKMIVFGGDTGAGSRILSNEVWIFDLSTMRWTLIDISSSLSSSSQQQSSSLHHLASSTISTTNSSSTQANDELIIPPPPPRSHFGATVCQNQLVIFGGSGRGESEKLNDLFALDLSSLEPLHTIPFQSLQTELHDTCQFVYEEMLKTHEDATAKEIRSVRKMVDQKVLPLLQDLKDQFGSVVREQEKFLTWSDDQMEQLEEQERQFFVARPFVHHNHHGADGISVGKIIGGGVGGIGTYVPGDQMKQTVSGRIILNVGGSYFDTTLATLTRDSSTLLAAMFSGRYPLEAEERKDDGTFSYFIDRDPLHFRYCLNFLRDNAISLPPNRSLHLELLREASFYQISSLVDFLRISLRKLDVALEPNGPEAEKERMKGKSKI